MLMLPQVSVAPLESWHAWNCIGAARISGCRKYFYNGVDARGVRWQAPVPRPCDNLKCRSECAEKRIRRLLEHLFACLVPEPRVWAAFVHVPSSAYGGFRKDISQRSRRATMARAHNGLPAVDYALFSTWDGWRMVVANHDLVGRTGGFGGSWLIGAQAYDLLHRTVCRVGVLEHWPSFPRGSLWTIPADPGPDGSGTLDFLGDWTPGEAERRFVEAADEAEQRWGVRPVDGRPPPGSIPVDEWIKILKSHFTR